MTVREGYYNELADSEVGDAWELHKDDCPEAALLSMLASLGYRLAEIANAIYASQR